MGHLSQSLSLSTVKLDIVYSILFLVSICAAQGKITISMLLFMYIMGCNDIILHTNRMLYISFRELFISN